MSMHGAQLSDVPKRKPGRPPKNTDSSPVSFNRQAMLDNVEEKLTAQLSDLVAQALALLRSLVESQSDRITTLSEELQERIDQLDSFVNDLAQKLNGNDTSIHSTNASCTAGASPPLKSSGPPARPPARASNAENKYNVVVYGIK